MSDEHGDGGNQDSNETEETWGDTVFSGNLKPRHRRLAQLHAEGATNNEIAAKLGYTPSRVSILLTNHKVKEEVERVRERIYQDTVANRLKDMAEPALNVVQECLTDQTNKWKENLKADMSKWVLEKLDGKATQKVDIGENTLALFLDRLDAAKTAGRIVDVTPQQHALSPPEGGVTIDIPPQTEDEKEEIRLREWVSDLGAPSQSKK